MPAAHRYSGFGGRIMIRWWPLFVCSALSIPGAAFAQATPPGPDQEVSPTDITVTARRREERLADVPIAVSARNAAKGIAGAQLVEYEDAPHGLFATDGERLTKDLLTFLGR